MLKILFAIDSLRGGGKERQFVELIKGMRNSTPHEIRILIFSQDIHFSEIHNLGIKIYLIQRTSINKLYVFRYVYDVLKDFKPDIIHSWNPMVSFYLIFFKHFFRFKMIEGSIRSAPPTHVIPFNEYWLIRIISLFSDRVVANSLSGLASFKIRKRKMAISNGFDMNRISAYHDSKPREPGKKNIRIGMVGNFNRFKDYDTFFAAAGLITSKFLGTEFFAIGGGPRLQHYQEKFRDHENFFIPGPQKEVEEYITNFDICVLCSAKYGEGISNSLLEYMSLKKPVVALDCQGNREVVADGKTGLLYRFQDPRSLAEKLEQLIGDEKLREKLGQAGYEVLNSKFSYDKMISSYSDLYEELMAEKKNKNS